MIKSTLTAVALAMLLTGPAFGDDDDDRRGRGRGNDRDDRHDRRDDDWRDHDRGDSRRHDRDDDRGRNSHWRSDGQWRNDQWRNDNWRNDRHWRHVPPVRYRADFGYRSGYEHAWRDWHQYGRHDRNWRRSPAYGFRVEYGYRSGYEAGWRDAARNYGPGYRPGYWARDPRDGWYFGFHIDG